MEHRLQAISVASHDDSAEDFWLVGFQGQAERNYLILTYDPEPDRQDRDLGLVGVHLEFGGQGKGGYRVIERMALAPQLLTLTLGSGLEGHRIDVHVASGTAGWPDAANMLRQMAAADGIPLAEPQA